MVADEVLQPILARNNLLDSLPVGYLLFRHPGLHPEDTTEFDDNPFFRALSQSDLRHLFNGQGRGVRREERERGEGEGSELMYG